MVHSLAGELLGGRIATRRPFRAPHHSASMAALVGGGSKPRPGEVSLAHLGVLFLDGLPEFLPNVLDALPNGITPSLYLLYATQVLVILATFVVGILLIPSLTSSIFSGSGGQSALPEKLRMKFF